jgi:hypothetical protein
VNQYNSVLVSFGSRGFGKNHLCLKTADNQTSLTKPGAGVRREGNEGDVALSTRANSKEDL